MINAIYIMHKDGLPIFHREYGYIPFSNEGNPQIFTGFCSALFSFVEGLILGSSKIESVRLSNMNIFYSKSKSFVFVLISEKYSSELLIDYALNLIKGKFLQIYSDSVETEVLQIDPEHFKDFISIVDDIVKRIEDEQPDLEQIRQDESIVYVNNIFEQIKSGKLDLETGQDQIISFLQTELKDDSWLVDKLSSSWLKNGASSVPKFREPLPRADFVRSLRDKSQISSSSSTED
ncbi:MAG: hypothetical protein ACFFCZ_00745 [Promethearchaeota archaeon]